ncbi:hypothetical protein VP01_773g12 [Puccinia sorghi]|uniref:Uncharacterized protein n=1 Tax=Puccinia sorghi TaxID=27349 RepID=A0A0L6UBI0_9BASI|nr:hypothetical protein VP01_773g12 [Puccinia sorghi]
MKKMRNKQPPSTGTISSKKRSKRKEKKTQGILHALSTKAQVIYMQELREMGLECNEIKKLVDNVESL